MNPTEEVILEVLKESGCKSQETMITPKQLIAKCKEKGADDIRTVEAGIVSLIDQDLVEYEMDASLQTSELWLL